MHPILEPNRIIVAVALALVAGCSSEALDEPANAAGQALSSDACINELPGQFSKWLFDEDCSCPKFGDARDEQCAYESALAECAKANGGTFDCKRPPPLPIVASITKDEKGTTTFDELRISPLVNDDCGRAWAIEQCIEDLAKKTAPDGTPYADKPVQAEIQRHCDHHEDVCAGKLIYNTVWDPCTTKACVQ